MPAYKSGENTPLGPYFRDANGSVHLVPDISPLGKHIADATEAVGTYPSTNDGKPTQLFTGTTDPLSYHPQTAETDPETDETISTPPRVSAENFTPPNPEKIRQWALIDAHASLAFTEFETAQYPLSAALRDLENTERAIVETIIMQLNDNAVRHRVQDALGLENGDEITERLTDIDDDATIYNTGYSLLTAVLENSQAFNIESLEQQISSQGTLAEQHQQLMTLISPLLMGVAEMVAGKKEWPENISVEGQNNISAIVTYLQDMYRESPQATIQEVLYDMEFTHTSDLNRLEDAFPELVESIHTQRSLANVVVDALTKERVEQVLRENGDLLRVSELPKDTVYLSAENASRALLSFRLAEPKEGREVLLDSLRAEVEAEEERPVYNILARLETVEAVERSLVTIIIDALEAGETEPQKIANALRVEPGQLQAALQMLMRDANVPVWAHQVIRVLFKHSDSLELEIPEFQMTPLEEAERHIVSEHLRVENALDPVFQLAGNESINNFSPLQKLLDEANGQRAKERKPALENFQELIIAVRNGVHLDNIRAFNALEALYNETHEETEDTEGNDIVASDQPEQTTTTPSSPEFTEEALGAVNYFINRPTPKVGLAIAALKFRGFTEEQAIEIVNKLQENSLTVTPPQAEDTTSSSEDGHLSLPDNTPQPSRRPSFGDKFKGKPDATTTW